MICGTHVTIYAAPPNQAGSCYKYNSKTRTSSQLMNMLQWRAYFAISKFGDHSQKVFVSGGKDDNEVHLLRPGFHLLFPGQYKDATNAWAFADQTEVYDPSTNVWTATAPVPTSILEHCMESISGNEIVLFAGRTGSGGSTVHASTYIYNVNSNSWTTLAETFPRPRRQLCCER